MALIIESVEGELGLDRFFDGHTWELRRGEDYDVDSRQIARAIRRLAKSRGFVARTNTNQERVQFKVLRPLAE